jgi:hypothetical protein
MGSKHCDNSRAGRSKGNPVRRHLTYANVTASVALFLTLAGGVVYAAGKIGTSDIKRHAVKAPKLGPQAVKNGKLALGAVGNQQLADGAVGNQKLADGAVANSKIQNDSIEPSKLTFPVFYTAEANGGSQAVTNGPDPYPLTGSQWTQRKDAINVVFGAATATLAYDGSGSGSCQVFFDVRIDDQQLGGGQLTTSSTSFEQVDGQIGAAPGAGPTEATPHELTVFVSSNGDCESGSTIDSTRFQVLDVG